MSRRLLMIPAALALLSVASTASAAIYVHRVTATEAEECPAPPAPNGLAKANGSIVIDTNTNTISYDIIYSDLNGTFSAAHIHGFAGNCPATTGIKITLTNVGGNRLFGSAVYLEADEASYLAGQSYVNIHTSLNPGGQIRDQVTPVAGAVPGSNLTVLLLLAGGLLLAGTAWMARRRTA